MEEKFKRKTIKYRWIRLMNFLIRTLCRIESNRFLHQWFNVWLTENLCQTNKNLPDSLLVYWTNVLLHRFQFCSVERLNSWVSKLKNGENNSNSIVKFKNFLWANEDLHDESFLSTEKVFSCLEIDYPFLICWREKNSVNGEINLSINLIECLDNICNVQNDRIWWI